MATYQVETDGGTYQVETADEAPSKLESFGRGAANNVPLAPQAISALSDGDYSKNLADWNDKAAGAKAANPVSYGAGAVTGAMAPLAIPGVGEAMEAAPIASGAALGAANAVSNTDLVNKPDEAIKQGLEGAATGGVLGGILPNGQKAAEGLENFANRKAVQGLGLKPGMLGIPTDELEDLGKFASDARLTQGPLEQRVGQAKDLLQQVGAQIGDIGAGSRPLADPSSFVDKLHSHLQESASIFGPEANAEAPIYRQAIANISKPGITFDELQQLKSAYGQRAFDSMGNVKNDAAANVYGQIKEAMKSIVSDSPAEYQDAMDTYGKLNDIHSGLNNQWQQEQAKGAQMKGIGMIGRMGGAIAGGNVPATATAAGLATITGHPLWGLGLGATLAQNPQAMEAAARGASEMAPGVANAIKLGTTDSVTSYLMNKINSSPQSLGKFAKPLMQAAQTGGSQGLAVQHFLLSSQYPEYNEMMQKQDDGGNNNADR